jgi:hypothetical protein
MQRLASGRPLGELQRFSGVIGRVALRLPGPIGLPGPIAGEPDLGKHHRA